jgi:hypothetical protein
MKTLTFVLALAAAGLIAGAALAGELKSGPQPGEQVPGPFHVLNACNAEKPEANGSKSCLYCQHADKAVAMLFVREVTPEVTALLKKIDSQVAKSGGKMGAFVVYLTEDEKQAATSLKALAEKENLKHVSLAVDGTAGPAAYKVARDAAVTVVLYKVFEVKANHAYKKGEFTAAAVEAVVKDLPKISAN